MQRLECPTCHGYVDEKDSECPECYAELPRRTALPPASGTFVPRAPSDEGDAPSDGDALPSAVAHLGRGALPAGPSPYRATAALQLARLLTIAVAGWVVVMAYVTWGHYRDGYMDALLPAWNSAFAVGVGAIAYGVLMRRRWALRWAAGVAIFNGLSNVHTAATSGVEWLWIGVALHALCAIALFSARQKFVDGPNDGRNARLGHVLSTLAVAGTIYVWYAHTTREPGTERGRQAFAAELEHNMNVDGSEAKVSVVASGRALVMTLREASNAEIDAVAAAWSAGLEEAGKNARVWVLGFERIRFTNGTHEALILER